MAKPVSRNLNAYSFIISGINSKPMYKHQAVIDFDCQRERKITQRASVIRTIVFAAFFHLCFRRLIQRDTRELKHEDF